MFSISSSLFNLLVSFLSLLISVPYFLECIIILCEQGIHPVNHYNLLRVLVSNYLLNAFRYDWSTHLPITGTNTRLVQK